MAHVMSLFQTYADADKAVHMLVERDYPADQIWVVAAAPTGAHRLLSGGDVINTQVDNILVDLDQRGGLLGSLSGSLGGARKSEDLTLSLTTAGVLPDQTERYAQALREGQVLVSVATEDFRQSDVRNILDNAAGLDVERYFRGDYGSAEGQP